MSPFAIPVRRPVATAMFFIALILLGWIGLERLPVELFPSIGGSDLYVQFFRPGSEPEAIEREILLPLSARVSEFAGVDESWGEIQGTGGTLTVHFDEDVDLRARELELRRVAADLEREQPLGTSIEVSSQDFAGFSAFVMYVQVTGMDDRNSLLDMVEQHVNPRLAAVPGVSRVLAGGGAPREVTVTIDPDRSAALGVDPQRVSAVLASAVRRLDYLGRVRDDERNASVVLDARPKGIASLGELRVAPDRPVLLRHVAEVDFGAGREEMLFRINGEPTVAMVVFKDQEANLVSLGRELRVKLDELREEHRHLGIDFVVNFDAAELIEEQIGRLKQLGLTGFIIALVVLFLFLRQIRAVAVVAVAVPASLLCALALFYVGGLTLNLITLFGLAVGIGMLVDNSIVVYEAVQRQLELGSSPDAAAEWGVRRTARAILGASATNAVVFLPATFVDFDDAVTHSLLTLVALAILLPLLGSVIVAIGLVPLLARKLAAPAALRRLARTRERKELFAGLNPPDRSRELFTGILVSALRRPSGWITLVVTAILLTVVIALPGLALGSLGREGAETDQVRFTVELPREMTIDRATEIFARLEQSVEDLEGIDRHESVIREESGTFTVHLLPEDERPPEITAAAIRERVRRFKDELESQGVEVDNQTTSGGGGGGGSSGRSGGIQAVLGQGPESVAISGSETRELYELANNLVERLESIDEIANARVLGSRGREEIRVYPDLRALEAFGLTTDQVLPVLNVVRREGAEMRVGFTLPGGREIPMVVRREPARKKAVDDIERLRLATPAGVLPLAALADARRVTPRRQIQHHNGRRELEVRYSYEWDAPETGAARAALEARVGEAISEMHRPAGYTVETPAPDESFNWFRTLLVPVLLLLYGILALTFESLTLPVLVLLALPLTVLGAVWALLLSGMPADPMALIGVLALIGLTVNPAILLVDRMQQRAWRGGLSAGAAALAAVRERTRPVLMTATTTIAGLWPLALVTGKENEIWPPFATVMMGGLLTSTVLTLLMIPVGFVFLHRLDQLFGRLGPWISLSWIGITVGLMTFLVRAELIQTTVWRTVTAILIATLVLAAAVLIFRRPEKVEPKSDEGTPPRLDVRYLHKIYGRPGPVGRALRAPETFAQRVVARGGRPFDPKRALERLLPNVVALAGTLYLAWFVSLTFWHIVWVGISAGLAGSFFHGVRRARGRVDRFGRTEPGGFEGIASILAPWVVIGAFATRSLMNDTPDIHWITWSIFFALAFLFQFGRATAARIARGDLSLRIPIGFLRGPRAVWRSFCSKWMGFDMPREVVNAVRGVNFEAEQGMIGVLGPNGAGKTTLLRQLAGILEPSVGRVTLGGAPLEKLRRHLARYVGYLPQEFGLPGEMTARQYLEYFALLYEIRPAAHRRERVDGLLRDVGLNERADEKIGGYSGGMRQRVAVARSLLRLPAVIIVDEPTVGLDPRERIRFRNLLARLASGRIVLFSTHVVEDVAVACERVLVMGRGKLLFDGQPAALSHRAAGRVWEVRVAGDGTVPWPESALVVDEVPEQQGVRYRVLSRERPHEEAREIEPTLEDGYLWLVGDRVQV